jgi:hypothetical protein
MGIGLGYRPRPLSGLVWVMAFLQVMSWFVTKWTSQLVEHPPLKPSPFQIPFHWWPSSGSPDTPSSSANSSASSSAQPPFQISSILQLCPVPPAPARLSTRVLDSVLIGTACSIGRGGVVIRLGANGPDKCRQQQGVRTAFEGIEGKRARAT